jgi:hypothetical protein
LELLHHQAVVEALEMVVHQALVVEALMAQAVRQAKLAQVVLVLLVRLLYQMEY